MAPIKFEEHIKEKLEEREIQPSTGSWDTLNSRLNKTRKSSGKKWWVSSVAAVVVLLIVSMVFVNLEEQFSNPVVENPVEKEVRQRLDKVEFENPVQVVSEENKGVVEEKSGQVNDINTTLNSNKSVVAENSNVSAKKNLKEISSEPILKRQKVEAISVEPALVVENFSSQLSNKGQEVLEKIKREEQRSGDLTSAEVDALLAEAAKNISRERNLFSEGSISADALLADVEYEVDQSFRKEVFDFLKEEFLKAKTAVATRNE
ncbi:hypothetical protein [Christiangramia sp.]|uniref:hypothetical protein n=1 Tax=Christiangramia sp. TaxID=1931228 RepID=UPI002620280E|nr:hypothetical protein [Christiangramia sp.]